MKVKNNKGIKVGLFSAILFISIVVSFICGSKVGDNIGEFIYNLKH